ncbi:MAG TPA: hypothetical protein VGJ33_11690 [Candidatus Angelobacter sp.]|jgi:hypothetical protein
MATAKHPHLNDSSAPKKFDVYSPTVVVYEGETFDWNISGQDGQSGVSVTKYSPTWPFTETSFGVALGPGTPATVLPNTAGQYQFECTPAAPTTPQNLIVAKVYNECRDPQAAQGGYFAWQNTQNGAIVVNPDPTQTWPLVENAPVVIHPNTTKIVQVSPSATVGDHGIGVTIQQGGRGACAQAGTPKIIVTAPPVPKPKPKHSH